MSHLAPLIADLALILICAGIMTLLFKKLKQPLVLGYVVAGFLASPHLSFTPSVMDTANIQTWADIGVIFLLFALGLEFSFKKIVKVGGAAIIAACTIIFCMIMLGIGVGTAFGWQRMDCIFLGGMIAMSSTTIIYKAFDDLGLRKKQFTGLVLSVLILEDILAIVLMVMLSTMAVSNNFEGTEMLESVVKLLFFLILWFVVGIYLIPELLKRSRKLMSEETLLIVSLGLCFGMVVVAAHTGFSAAFGAFIMGSILAETVEAESIERLVNPVKDLFGAIFFVSVGMMVDPAMIVEYAWPIVFITLAVIVGQSVFGTLGVLLAGQPLKMAMQCGFSLTQIGEFAFIIASLGVSLKVTSDFLYPIEAPGILIRFFPRRIETTCTPYFFPKFSSSNVFPAHEASPGISKSAKCKSRDNSRPAYSGFFSPLYSATISRVRRFWKNLRSIIMDCFLSWRDNTMTMTSNTATPNSKPTEALNSPAMTNMTNETANKIRNTIVATSGARLPRLSFHKVTNSSEWFFFIMIERRKGDMNRMMTNAANNGPQTPGNHSRHRGTKNLKANAMMAMQTME